MTTQTYQNSVNKLLDAYNSGTLEHGDCRKCAVRNLLSTPMWGADFTTTCGFQEEDFDLNSAHDYISKPFRDLGIDSEDEAKEWLQKLYSENGFTREELMYIEYVFESSIHESEEINDKKVQLIGLTAVLSAMENMIDDKEESFSSDAVDRLNTIAKENYHIETA